MGRLGMAVVALWGAAAVSSAWADTIVMTNGDRLSGEVLLMDGGRLILDTDYAGEIRIKWEQIAELQTNDPVLLRAKGLPAGYEARLVSVGQPGNVAAWPPDSDADEAARDDLALADIQGIVRPRPFLRDWVFEGGVDLALGATHASKSNQNWNAAANAIVRRDMWRHGVNLDYTRKSQDGVVGTYNYNIAYAVDRFLSDKFFVRGRLRYGRDRVDDPAHQVVFAAGPGYQFWDDELSAFSMSTFLTHTRYTYHDDTDEDFETVGLGWNFTRHLAGKRWQVFTKGEVNRAFKGDADYSLETELGLRYNVTQWMSLYAKAAYDRITMSGKPSTNERRYSVGLGVNW